MQLKPALRKATELGIALTAVATLVLAGCGGKSSSGSAAADMTTLSISPSLGRFSQGANVRIRDRSGIQIGSGYTDASGVASIAVPTSAQAPLLVEAGLNGDRYYDEKQGLFVSVSGVNGVAVRALVPDHTATSQVAVTALTEIAVGSLTNASGVVPVGVSAASAVGANATVAQSFGVADLLVPPKLVGSKTDVNGLGSTEADKYALKLAALANMAGTGEDALKVAHRLRNDLNLATPASGIAATITAMKAFMVSMPSAPAGATTIANAIVVPHANAKLADLIPAAMNAANTQLAALDPALTKAQVIAAINAAALNNASGVMAAIATGQVPASAIQAALQQAQQQASSATTAVTGFSPASGVVGASVTITGSGFDPFFQHNTVKFNGTLATVTSGSTTSLTVTVPAGATTGSISVTNIMSLLANKTGTSAGSFTVGAATSASATPQVPASTTAGRTPKFAYVANGRSNNVSAYTINGTTGALTAIAGSPFPAGITPNSVTVDPSGKFAYVANTGGGVSAYTINGTTGALTAITGSPFAAGSFPWSVTVDPSGKFAYVANTGGGVSAYTINGTTGALTAITGSPFLTAPANGYITGVGGANPKSVTVDPSGKFAYVASGGFYQGSFNVIGSVSAYTINGTTGALTEITGSPLKAGSFPQSMTVDPSGKFAYVANSGGVYGASNVSVYTINGTTGALTEITGSPFPAGVGPQSVTVDPSGKFAYVANNNSYNVSAYTINGTTGALTAITGSPFTTGVNGLGPQSVTVDPSGKFAYVANDSSNTVSVYTINGTTGALTQITGSPFTAGTNPQSVTVW